MINRIAIIGAMDSEIEYLKKQLELNGDVASSEIDGFVFYFGKLFNKEIILVKSGIGRVNAAILMTILHIRFANIDKIINIGTAGGYGNFKVGDIIVGKISVYGDVDVRGGEDFEGKYRYGQMCGYPHTFAGDNEIIEKIILNNIKIHLGCICTCDSFTVSYEKTKNLVDSYFQDLNVLAFDMESAAFAQAALQFKMPFLSIRAISDVIGGSDQTNEFLNNFEEASEKSNIFLMQVLEIL